MNSLPTAIPWIRSTRVSRTRKAAGTRGLCSSTKEAERVGLGFSWARFEAFHFKVKTEFPVGGKGRRRVGLNDDGKGGDRTLQVTKGEFECSDAWQEWRVGKH